MAEEPALTAAVSVRPGVIDTQMQADVRARHTGAMGPVAAERFVQLHREGKLIRFAPPPPSFPFPSLLLLYCCFAVRHGCGRLGWLM